MIALVTAVLGDLGLLPARRTPRYHIGITRGDTLWFHAFVDNGFYHVKAAEVVNLDREVQSYNTAWTTYAELMPRPLGYRHLQGWHFFVTEGISFRPIPRRRLFDDSGTVRAISGFFEITGRNKVVTSVAPTATSLLERLDQRFRGSAHASVLVPWRTDTGRRDLEALGSAPQHGDFVLSNLGLVDRRLVVFDWEDYGKIALPGFDLCTLVVSSIDVGTFDGRGLVTGASPVANRFSVLVVPACRALGIDVALFWRCVPLYLLAFLYLKDDYSTDVRRRFETCLTRLCDASAR